MPTFEFHISHTLEQKFPFKVTTSFPFPSILPLSPKNSAKRSFKVIKCIIVCEHLLTAARGQACGVSSLLTPLWVLGLELGLSGLRNQHHPVTLSLVPKETKDDYND